jgi:hypothetical protein
MEIFGQLVGGAGAGVGVTVTYFGDLKLVTWFFVGIWFWGPEKIRI